MQCEDFDDAVQLDDEMEEEDVEDTHTGPQLIQLPLEQPELTSFSLPTPQIAS